MSNVDGSPGAPADDTERDRPAESRGHAEALPDERAEDPGTQLAGLPDPGTEASEDSSQRATLIAVDRARGYQARWTELKGEFVDEPRRAVRGADELVGEVLDELAELFRRQRAELEASLGDDQTSTEDLRLALGRYRSFFDRLLSF